MTIKRQTICFEEWFAHLFKSDGLLIKKPDNLRLSGYRYILYRLNYGLSHHNLVLNASAPC